MRDELPRRVAAFMEQYRMLAAGDRVLVALSGGGDSMCLLHLLCSLADSYGISVCAAHLNHCLRGADADADEAFVADYCAERGILCCTAREDAAAFARERRLSPEEAARILRYAFLERTADAVGAQKIATAHHAGDQAETVLHNLIRGCGSEGLGGIPPVRGRLIRPLLLETRSELHAYLRRYELPFREDATNADTRIERNFLRLRVLPLLTEQNEAAIPHIARTALLQRRESAYLDRLAGDALGSPRLEKDGVSVPLETLLCAEEVLRFRMLRLLLNLLPVGKKDISAAHLFAAEAMLHNPCSASLSLPHGIRLRKEKERFYLSVRSTESPTILLPPEETVSWGGFVFFRTGNREHLPNGVPFLTLYCPADASLSIGAWRRRDWFQFAEGRFRSVKRCFSDAGFSPERRDACPVLYCGSQLAALCGIGTDYAYLGHNGNPVCYIAYDEKGEKKL